MHKLKMTINVAALHENWQRSLVADVTLDLFADWTLSQQTFITSPSRQNTKTPALQTLHDFNLSVI